MGRSLLVPSRTGFVRTEKGRSVRSIIAHHPPYTYCTGLIPRYCTWEGILRCDSGSTLHKFVLTVVAMHTVCQTPYYSSSKPGSQIPSCMTLWKLVKSLFTP